MDFIKRTWAEIDLDAFAHNIKMIRSHLKPEEKMMGIVKADAYGHGDIFLAKRMEQMGFDWFGVSNIDEARHLRRAGIQTPILILGYTPIEAVSLLHEYSLTQTIISFDYALMLQEKAREQNLRFDIQIKIDTGMNRIGFSAEEECFLKSLEEIKEITKMECMNLVGIFTHYAVADSDGADAIIYTKEQFEKFKRMKCALEMEGIAVGICHTTNSAGTISYHDYHMDMCRLGILLYGILPSASCENMIDVKPIMTLKTTVSMVKKVPKGKFISYGKTYETKEERRIATVPIGYGDGYNLGLSNRGRMLVGGEFAPIVGRVCMDQTMIDVTNLADVCIGDEVVVFGIQKEALLSVEEISELLCTIPYEITCVLTKRVPRVYLEQGKILGIVNHVLQQEDV